MKRQGMLAAIALLGIGCSTPMLAAPLAPCPVPAASDAPLDVVADRSMPAVVLLLNTRADGTVLYGSGLVVDGGLVLTNHHVVAGAKSLGAMLFKKDRVGYTPMDGGLGRYLFENPREVLKATVVDAEPGQDLALVRVDGDTSKLPRLRFASAPVKVGDRVIALGHPQEIVWSFTSGVVGAIQANAIQHDAIISAGSSGGPLLNAKGEVVGINTAKVVSESRGLGFARPIALAATFLAPQTSAAEVLARFGTRGLVDLASPETALKSCWHAEELRASAVVECIDWDAKWLASRAGLAREDTPGERASWIDRKKKNIVDALHTDAPSAGEATRWTPGDAAAARTSKSIADAAPWLQRLREKNGLKVDLSDPARRREVLKMGVRVEEVRLVSPALAWLRATGRNPDGTSYTFSECLALADGKWLRRSPPLPADLALLPAGFPPPLDAVETDKSAPTAGAPSGGASRPGTALIFVPTE